jgi:hypothetical protein
MYDSFNRSLRREAPHSISDGRSYRELMFLASLVIDVKSEECQWNDNDSLLVERP